MKGNLENHKMLVKVVALSYKVGKSGQKIKSKFLIP